jgi:hypothetical protein
MVLLTSRDFKKWGKSMTKFKTVLEGVRESVSLDSYHCFSLLKKTATAFYSLQEINWFGTHQI